MLPVVLPVVDDTDLAGIGVFAATPDETQAIMDDDPGVPRHLHLRDAPGPRLPRRRAALARSLSAQADAAIAAAVASPHGMQARRMFFR